MASSQSTVYSQGFNFGSFIQEGVDPRTGQFTCTITLFETPANTINCPPLKLCLSFNPLNNQDIGFGVGWSLNLSSFQHRGSMTLSLSTGEHFKIAEEGGELKVKDQKLQSFQFKKLDTEFQITHKSGLMEILSNHGDIYNVYVPTEIQAPSGRSLKLEWIAFENQPRLANIQDVQDGFKTLFHIEYEELNVTFKRAPGSSEESTLIAKKSNHQLDELQLPAENTSESFVYETFTYDEDGRKYNITCLKEVTRSSGLVEKAVHQEKGHKLPNKAPYHTIPYVVEHTADPRIQPPITTSYSYSPNNFFGQNGVSSWSYDEDNLYRAIDNYQYTSTVKVTDGPERKYTYNKYHLLTRTEQTKGNKQVITETTYYASVDKDFWQQPAQYQLPTCIKISYRDTSTGQTSPDPHTTYHEYDEFGNPTLEARAGITTRRVYYSPEGEKDLCPRDPHDFFKRHVKSETVIPAASPYQTPTRRKGYKYLRLDTVAGSLTKYFIAVQQMQTVEENKDLLSTEYTYVQKDKAPYTDHGRLQSLVTLVGGQSHSTRIWGYDYSITDRLTESTETKSFDGNTIKDETTYCMLTGLIRAQRNDNGVEEIYDYDKMGRLVKATVSRGTAFEATRQHEYAIAPGGAGYCLTATDAKGLKTRYITDGFERICRVERQDDDWQYPGAADNGTFRAVQELRYDQIGQCIQVDSIDLLRAQNTTTEERTKKYLAYDDWGQVCKTTDSSGVTTLALTDPINLTQTRGIEGQGKIRTQFNLLGVPTQTAILHKDGSVYSKVDYDYDGLGRLIKETDNLGRIKQFQVDSYDRVTQTSWPDGRTSKTQFAAWSTAALPVSIDVNDQAVGTQSFDGLGRPRVRTVGGRTTIKTYQRSTPKPIQIMMPNGDKHNLTYEPELNDALTTVKSFDGADMYQHDKQSGVTIGLNGTYSTENRRYLPSGLLVEESFEIDQKRKFSTQSTYSMNGKLQTYTDVHGQKHTLQYDGFGRPQQLVQGTAQATFAYDEASRLYESCIQDGNQSLTTRRKYDEFGREVYRTVFQGAETMYQLSQTYNETSLITRRQIQDGKATVLRDETYQYDSCDRLVDYQCEGLRPPVNEKGHELQHQHFTFDQYNNLVQVSTTFPDGGENKQNKTCHFYSTKDPTQLIRITNTHPKYPAEINLEYDENGRLTRDEQGRTLQYDTRNRLRAVQDKGQIISQYHYDAAGKLVCQEMQGKSTCLHYHGDALIATTGDSKVSYIYDGNTYWGQALQQGEKAQTQLWASDAHESILAWVDTQKPDDINHQQYAPYGYSTGKSSIGFNGHWKDPVTGWYHLGNGYRIYNPVLMRFHTPDSWSPFTSGEINPYAYCLGDPINNTDPSGHMAMTGRDWAIMGVGVAVGILVGIFTAGAGTAIAVGTSIAVGSLTDAATGAIFDAASGKSPSIQSIGTDMLLGAVGGAGGEVVGRGFAAGAKALSRGVKGILEAGEKLRVAGGVPGRHIERIPIETLPISQLLLRDINFSQDSIRATFANGTSVLDEITRIRGMATTEEMVAAVNEFPRISVARLPVSDGNIKMSMWFSFDNRRLAVFKASLRGIEDQRINVRVLTAEEAADHWRKLTTGDYGQSLNIREEGIVLGLSESVLLEMHCGAENESRLLHYPTIPASVIKDGNVTRIARNTDFGTITLLFQASVDGLEVEIQKNYGQFCPVVSEKTDIIINIGDPRHQLRNDVQSSLSSCPFPTGSEAVGMRIFLGVS
ncbi:conserved hypothetical protein [Paecilomyces variotii No. 5]|uniref:Teneurin-like YD-shell domain-containing protein n=1 Tax=Byssochlamys spectabilis (strain No. 5 / NBRC 109023) TaxID=1356009 RepID=V5HVH9_BYSSN|nr:conserved hypothetical protein [Paecilomyces variotii No. 5]